MADPTDEELAKDLRHWGMVPEGLDSFLADRLETLIAERDAEKARADDAEARGGIAEDLLKRVVIHGGAGSWTWREMHDWCCDYQDWSNGHGRESYERTHDNCRHRKRPGTDCGAIGAGDSDEPVHHLFGPEGLWARAEAAEADVERCKKHADKVETELGVALFKLEKTEARVAELEAERAWQPIEEEGK